MRKYVLILVALVMTAFLAGCGSEKSTTDSTDGITTVAMADTEFTGKTLFMKSTNIKSSNNNFQLNSDKTIEVNGTQTGTWLVSAAGNIEIRDLADKLSATFTCIQKETEYFLVYNTTTNEINRLYLDPANATNFDPTRMGGAVQGTDLILTDPATVTVSTFAGSLTGIPSTSLSTANGTGTAALFNRPIGITTDGTHFYVTDFENHAIRKITSDGVVTTIAGTGSAGSAADTVAGNQATFNHPNGITCAGDFLYVVDTDNHVIRKMDKDGLEVTRFAGFAGTAGTVDNENGKSAGFNTPIGITTDGTNLYVADSGNHTIRKIRLSSTPTSVNEVTTIAGNVGSVGTANGKSIAARFNLPSRITTDGSNLYVTDFNNRTIRKIVIATGVVSTLAGNPDAAPASIDTTATTAATFYHLGGITTDGTNLYITEFNDTIENDPNWISLVRKVDIDTGEVKTLAGGSIRTVVPILNLPDTSESGAAARFITPIGITTDSSGVYVTDSTGNNVRLLK